MSDHFNIESLIKCIGCPIKLINKMAICGFCLLSYNLHWLHMLFILFCIGSNPVLGDVLCVGSGVLFALTTVGEELLIKGEIGIIDFLALLGFSGTVVSSIQLLVLSDHVHDIKYSLI